MPPEILVIVGPTASGKSRLAAELALRCGGEVVSADSMQVYRRMDIGTAKPTRAEMRGVPHHLLDTCEPWEDFSVARYVELAGRAVDDILARGKLPILAGGTGLYLDSLLRGGDFAPPDRELRRALEERLAREGAHALLAELSRVDPETAKRLHPHDTRRILRALEVWQGTGKPITQHQRDSRAAPPRYRAATLGLRYGAREDLWRQIDRRVDEMVARGLAQEIRALLEEGVPRDCTAMQAIGYKEFLPAVEAGGDLRPAAEEVKLRTRQYAKRQMTWFRRDSSTRWITWGTVPDFDLGLRASTEYLEEIGLSL